jgi:hypothetical protein
MEAVSDEDMPEDFGLSGKSGAGLADGCCGVLQVCRLVLAGTEVFAVIGAAELTVPDACCWHGK